MTDTTGQEETAEQETSDTTDTAEQEATSSETPTETLELPGPEPLTESPPDDGKRERDYSLLVEKDVHVCFPRATCPLLIVPLVLFSSYHLSSSHRATCPLLIISLVLFSSCHLSSSHRATCPLLIISLVLDLPPHAQKSSLNQKNQCLLVITKNSSTGGHQLVSARSNHCIYNKACCLNTDIYSLDLQFNDFTYCI